MGFLASAGLSAIDGAIGFGGTMLQNYYNKQMAQYQNDYNTQMWHMQNEYNSPKETMNRLVEAGINPRAYQQLGQFANAGQPQPAAQMSKVSELSAFQGVVRQGLENQLLAEKVKQESNKSLLTKMQEYLTNAKIGDLEDVKEQRAVRHLAWMLLNGVDPNDLYGGYGVRGLPTINQDETGVLNDYTHTDLYKKYKNTDILSKSLLKGIREAEKKLKDGEVSDYENFGIRGNSDYVNLARFLFEVTGLGDKLADWSKKRKKKK